MFPTIKYSQDPKASVLETGMQNKMTFYPFLSPINQPTESSLHSVGRMVSETLEVRPCYCCVLAGADCIGQLSSVPRRNYQRRSGEGGEGLGIETHFHVVSAGGGHLGCEMPLMGLLSI